MYYKLQWSIPHTNNMGRRFLRICKTQESPKMIAMQRMDNRYYNSNGVYKTKEEAYKALLAIENLMR